MNRYKEDHGVSQFELTREAYEATQEGRELLAQLDTLPMRREHQVNLVQVDVSPDNEEEFGGISTDPMPEEEAWVLVKLILKYVPDVRVFMRASPEARPPRMTYTPLDDEL